MQKLLILFLCLLFGANAHFASNPSHVSTSVLNDDLSRLDCEMATLSQLEQLVEETHATQSQLVKSGNPLVSNLLPAGDLSTSLFGSTAPENDQLLNIPGFLWGFCCSIFGVLLVYISIDDPKARKKQGAQALIGCVAGTVLWAGIYIWLILVASDF